jgi:hypothetical protein
VNTKFREKQFFESNIIIKYGNTTNKDRLKGSDFDRTTKNKMLPAFDEVK